MISAFSVAVYISVVIHSTGIDRLLISWSLVFFGSSTRNIPLLSVLAVTSDERISSGTGILQ